MGDEQYSEFTQILLRIARAGNSLDNYRKICAQGNTHRENEISRENEGVEPPTIEQAGEACTAVLREEVAGAAPYGLYEDIMPEALEGIYAPESLAIRYRNAAVADSQGETLPPIMLNGQPIETGPSTPAMSFDAGYTTTTTGEVGYDDFFNQFPLPLSEEHAAFLTTTATGLAESCFANIRPSNGNYSCSLAGQAVAFLDEHMPLETAEAEHPTQFAEDETGELTPAVGPNVATGSVVPFRN